MSQSDFEMNSETIVTGLYTLYIYCLELERSKTYCMSCYFMNENMLLVVRNCNIIIIASYFNPLLKKLITATNISETYIIKKYLQLS